MLTFLQFLDQMLFEESASYVIHEAVQIDFSVKLLSGCLLALEVSVKGIGLYSVYL